MPSRPKLVIESAYKMSPVAYESKFKPPLEIANNPVQPMVMDAAFISAVAGVPPSVSVILVSFTAVSAAPDGVCQLGNPPDTVKN